VERRERHLLQKTNVVVENVETQGTIVAVVLIRKNL
jgi:hypothetical protein